MRGVRAGFTLPELLVATVLLGIVLAGLHQAHIQQRRVSVWQQHVAASHDAFRVASSVLSSELREAVLAEDDVVLLSADSIAVRSPGGFGFVCATRTNPAVLALNRVSGRMAGRAGDSLLVYAGSGWRAVEVSEAERPGQRGLRCAHGDPTPHAQYRLRGGDADDVPVGAPVRVFSRQRYHTVVDREESWLARTHAGGTDLLAGPLAAEGLRFRFLDAAGTPTPRSSDAVGVELQMVLRPDPRAGAPRPDTLVLVFQGRNR